MTDPITATVFPPVTKKDVEPVGVAGSEPTSPTAVFWAAARTAPVDVLCPLCPETPLFPVSVALDPDDPLAFAFADESPEESPGELPSAGDPSEEPELEEPELEEPELDEPELPEGSSGGVDDPELEPAPESPEEAPEAPEEAPESPEEAPESPEPLDPLLLPELAAVVVPAAVEVVVGVAAGVVVMLEVVV